MGICCLLTEGHPAGTFRFVVFRVVVQKTFAFKNSFCRNTARTPPEHRQNKLPEHNQNTLGGLPALPALGVGDPRECEGDIAILPSFGPPFFLLPFVFATLSSKQSSAEGTEASTKKLATMSPMGTDDTLRIRMQCTFIAWLFVTLYP